jgi:hypothetical protein
MAGTLSFNQIITDMQPDLQIIKLDADNETLTGTGVNMAGYQGVVFFAAAQKGEIANYDLKVGQASDAALSDIADLTGTKVRFSTAVGTDGFGFVEVQNPTDQYVAPILICPNVTTPTAVCVIALRYGKNWRPETNADGEVHLSPAEGTA